VCTSAIYALQSDGTVQVNNTCRISSPDGEVNSVIGTARIPDPEQPGQLEVKFGGPFWGAYWVVYISDTYDVAVVWSCQMVVPFMWILSRTPQLDHETYQRVLAIAHEKTGYDVEWLSLTMQTGCTY
jgi:lipocalin